MALDTTSTLGALTGARYIQSLRNAREVWLDGEKIQDITTHPAFTGIIHELARIYDIQHTDEYREQMTYVSEATGNRCSVSWKQPVFVDDLRKKRRNSEIWNEQCWGQLGRGPDILAPYMTSLYDARDALSSVENPELRPSLDRYMRGKDVDVEYKSRLYRLAHDLVVSSFGMRQEVYEYWHGGDPNRNRINLLRGYDQSDMTDRIKGLVSKPLSHEQFLN